MSPSRMKQFLVEERCVFSGCIALPTVPDFIAWCDARKAFRIIREAEGKASTQARNGGVPVGS